MGGGCSGHSVSLVFLLFLVMSLLEVKKIIGEQIAT